MEATGVCCVCVCVCMKYFLLVVEASTFSKRSFIDWVKSATFSPALGLNVECEFTSSLVNQPEKCNSCAEIWDNSRIVQAVKEAEWHLMKEKKDVANLVRRRENITMFIARIYII